MEQITKPHCGAAGSLTGLPLAFVNVCHRRVWLFACLLE